MRKLVSNWLVGWLVVGKARYYSEVARIHHYFNAEKHGNLTDSIQKIEVYVPPSLPDL